VTPRHILDFTARSAVMTSAGDHAPLLDDLPAELGALVRVVQGLLLHEHHASAYGVTLSDERRDESHIRPVERMLDRLLARDAWPLQAARPAEARLICVCRHFALLLVAMLRAKGIPARTRCGFADYFGTGRFEDHWVCEYWKPEEDRWVLVDAQIDELQRAKFKPPFDVLDVPRDRFLIAGEAWAKCRAGDADAGDFGIFDMRGLWFVAGNVLRDAAALNNMEMLPWDVWGAMGGPDQPLSADQLAMFDQLSALTRMPDAAFAALQVIYDADTRLRVPATVFNAVRRRLEPV
jgi:hypothetical protein